MRAAVVLAATACLLVAATLTLAPRQAAAKPEFAQQTGKPCGFCHVQPDTERPGPEAFKAKGFKL